MRTESQAEASRRNGAKSRGPITSEGKKRSSQNSVKYGLSARTVVLCTESQELFSQLEQGYIDALQPTNLLELHLVQHIAVAEWRIRRAYIAETAMADKSMGDHQAEDERENGVFDADFRLGLNQSHIDKATLPIQMALARFERSQSRALAEFHRLRKLRPPDAHPIQVDRPDVSTTGRDPAQPVAPPRPKISTNQNKEPGKEPCIIIQIPNDSPAATLEDDYPPPNLRLAS
jgi:hypothetical protein